MAAEDAATSYRQGIVWVVGMSAAAAGGAFLHYEQAGNLPLIGKISFIVLVALFLLAVWSGVNCLFWLFFKVSKEEKANRLEENHSQNRISNQDYTSQLTEMQPDLDEARKKSKMFHNIMLWTFAPAVLLSGILLGCATLSAAAPVEKKGPCTPEDKCVTQTRFAVVQSAIHQTAHGKEAHTFLLDQKKGFLWIMTCAKRGTVEFHRVQTFDVNGKPEDPSK